MNEEWAGILNDESRGVSGALKQTRNEVKDWTETHRESARSDSQKTYLISIYLSALPLPLPLPCDLSLPVVLSFFISEGMGKTFSWHSLFPHFLRVFSPLFVCVRDCSLTFWTKLCSANFQVHFWLPSLHFLCFTLPFFLYCFSGNVFDICNPLGHRFRRSFPPSFTFFSSLLLTPSFSFPTFILHEINHRHTNWIFSICEN